MNDKFLISDAEAQHIDSLLEERYLYKSMLLLFGEATDVGITNLHSLQSSLITDRVKDYFFPAPRSFSKLGINLGNAVTFTKDYGLVNLGVSYVTYNKKLMPDVKVTLGTKYFNGLPIIFCSYETQVPLSQT